MSGFLKLFLILSLTFYWPHIQIFDGYISMVEFWYSFKSSLEEPIFYLYKMDIYKIIYLYIIFRALVSAQSKKQVMSISMIIWLCLEILIIKIGTLYVNSLKICHNLTDSFHWVIFPWQAVKVVRIWKSWKQVSLLWDFGHFAEEIRGHLQLGIDSWIAADLDPDSAQAEKIFLFAMQFGYLI